jgi:hypothetical protein
VATDDLGRGDRGQVRGGSRLNATAVTGDQRVAVGYDVGGVPVEQDPSKFHCAPRVVCI